MEASFYYIYTLVDGEWEKYDGPLHLTKPPCFASYSPKKLFYYWQKTQYLEVSVKFIGEVENLPNLHHYMLCFA